MTFDLNRYYINPTYVCSFSFRNLVLGVVWNFLCFGTTWGIHSCHTFVTTFFYIKTYTQPVLPVLPDKPPRMRFEGTPSMFAPLWTKMTVESAKIRSLGMVWIAKTTQKRYKSYLSKLTSRYFCHSVTKNKNLNSNRSRSSTLFTSTTVQVPITMIMAITMLLLFHFV